MGPSIKKRQRLVLIAVAIIVLGMLAYPPHIVYDGGKPYSESYTKYGWLFGDSMLVKIGQRNALDRMIEEYGMSLDRPAVPQKGIVDAGTQPKLTPPPPEYLRSPVDADMLIAQFLCVLIVGGITFVLLKSD